MLGNVSRVGWPIESLLGPDYPARPVVRKGVAAWAFWQSVHFLFAGIARVGRARKQIIYPRLRESLTTTRTPRILAELFEAKTYKRRHTKASEEQEAKVTVFRIRHLFSRALNHSHCAALPLCSPEHVKP
jgi:hypothetical protein